MKRNIFSIKKLATALLCLFAFVGQGFAADVSIKTCAELQAFATCVNNGKRISSMTGYTSTTRCAAASVVLTQDIDCSGTTGLTPIGNGTNTTNQNYYFHGSFDGDGYSITGFTLNTNSTYAGLFGYVNGATIKNVSVDVAITQTNTGTTDKIYAGGLVAYLKSGAISNCLVSGTVKSTQSNASLRTDAGGVAGYMEGGTISDCLSLVAVEGINSTRSNLGGIVGFLQGGTNNPTIQRCVYDGSGVNVGENRDGGAIVGCLYGKVTIQNCFFDSEKLPGATVTGNNQGTITGEKTNSGKTTADLISELVMDKLGDPWDIVDGVPMPNGFRRHTVTVIYTYSDGSKTDTTTTSKKPGETYSITTPEVTGYTPDKTVVSGIMGTSDINVIVTYSPSTYIITYNKGANGTGSIPAGTKTYGVAYTLSDKTFTRTGYTQTGWATTDGGAQAYALGGSYTIDAAITLYPVWTINSHTVQYRVDGEVWSSSSAEYHATVTPPAAPTKTGYTFKQWNSSQVEWSANNATFTMIDEAVVVDAEYEVNSYTATFNANGGEFSEGVTTATKQVAYDAAITATDITEPTREGYAFKGWALTSDATAAAENLGTMNSTEGVTIYAVWQVNQYTITLNANGGTLGTGASPITQEYGTTIQTRANPTKTGYTFDGWFENQDLSGTAVTIPATMPAKTYTLYAKWTPAEVNYTVKTCTMETDSTYDESKCSTVTKKGFTESTADATPESFDTGFELDDGKSTLTGTVAADGSLALSVYIKRIAYTITFVNYDNALLQESDFLYGAIPVYSAATPTKAADAQYTYAFAGWSQTITEVTGTATYTAQFTPTPVSYTLTWDFAGGTAKSAYTAAGQVPYGTTLEIPEMEKEGYGFQGWSPEAPTTMPANNLTLTATWAPNQYTISFNSNGGSEVSPIVADYGATVAAPAAPTRDGYTFVGWFTDNGTFANEFTFSTMPLNGATLYAKWDMAVQATAFTGTYDGEPHGITVTAPAGATVTYSTAADGTYGDAITYTEAGAYTVYYKASQTGYADVKGSSTVTINQAADLAISKFDGATFTYDAAAHALSTAATTNAVTGTTAIEYQFDGDAEWTATLASLTKVAAGTYTVNVRATNPNYSNTAEGSATLTINEAAITVKVEGSTLSIKFNGGEWKTSGYTMNSESPLFDRSKVKFSGSTVVARTNAGKTFMGLKPTDFSYDDANITATFDVTDGYLEVLRAEVVVTITGHGVTETYDGTEKTATGYEISASNKGFDKGSVSYDGTSSVTAKNVGTVAMNLDETKFSSTDANFSKVTFEIAEDGYVTINPKVATLAWGSAEFTYTGVAQVPTATVSNLVDGDECTVTIDGAGTDVGNYTATATALDNSNYALPESGLTKAFSIAQATIVVETESAKRAYNGEALTASGSIKSGLVNDETATITLTGAQTDVGTSQNTFTMNWGTAKLANYKISSTLGTLEVIPAAVTVTADDKQKTYGGTDPTLTATVTGTVGEDKVEYTLSRATGENVGEYTITASGAATQGNYSVTFKTGKFTIAPASFTVAGTNYEGAYDGETHGVAATASVTEGTTVSYSTDGGTNWSATVPTITNVGEISVNVKAENANYTTATNTYVLKVTKRAITLVSASARKFYDGTALTAGAVTVSEGSYADGESFQYNVTGSQTDVGESDNEFTYSATSSASSAKVGNYEVTLEKGKLIVDPVVTFVMNGHGTQVTAQNVLTGEKASEPAEPSTEGYTFGGWFTDDGTFANAYDFDTEVTANTTLYAKWTVKKYMVTFVDEDGETVLASKDYDYGTAVADIEIPETPTKAEDNTYTYAFAGWSPELAAVTGVATYKATYTPTYKNYHIAFKTDANVVLFDKEDFHYGDALEAPSNPTREATDEYTYEFDKWDPAVPATVEGSQTYIAKFTPVPNKYTLTWDTDGGTITSAEDAYTAAGQVAYGTELVAPVVTKEGFTFTGWTPEVSTMPAEDATFKALWTEQLVVSFNVQGHGTAPASQLLDKNEKAVEPTAPMAQNYIFGGWFKDAACTQSWNFDDPVTESMELFAKWTGAFSLTFTLDGVDIETRSAVLEGTEITVLDSATKDDHEFAGWVMETEGVTFEAVTGGHKFVMPAKAVNISGAYKYFVKYKLDDDQVGDPETYTYGTEVTVREPETKTGYDISDWTSSVTITDGKFAMPAADVELTATSTVHKYSITYKVTGSYFADDAFNVTENVAYGTELSLITTDMTKEGYTFSGWSGLPATMPDNAVEVTGSYSINHYDVAWKNGEETFSSSSVAYDAKVSAPTTAPTKDGYDFTGWTTSDVDLADDYSFTMPAKAVTLNANWALLTYDIVYETNGGNAISSSSYTIESADVMLPTPTRTGYDFGGWFDNEGLSGSAVTKVAAGSFGNKKFYAKWSVITYEIAYEGLGDMTHENPATYTVEDAIVLVNPSDSTGYNFDGWYIGEDKVTGIAKGSTGDTTIVAKWSPKNVDFKVVYKLYGLTGTVEKTMAEEILQGPADALIIDHISWKNFGDGYSYELVYINGQEHNKSYFTDKIARDGSTIVEVRVEHNEFTFTFYTEGESGWEQWDAQPLYYGYDESENFKVKAPTVPTKTGYTFVGWCADAQTCESVQTFPMNVPAKNMNFYPKWTITQYTITFDTKGGSAIDAITQDYNTAVTAPEDPTRTDYLFAGWDKEIPAVMPAENITISANWNMDVKATGYTGVYDGNAHGITVTAPEGATVTYSDAEDGSYVAALTYADVGTYTVYYKASQEGYADVKGSATVTITPATMTLVVAGYTGTYDGIAHSGTATPSVTTGTTISYSVDNGTTWTTDVPTFTNAGTVDVKVKAENDNYETVTDDYAVAIAKRAVKLTSGSAQKFYDGMALTNDGITVDGSFANGETPKYTFTGSQTEAGSSENTFTVSMNSPASDDNYDFTLVNGTLTVDPVVTFVMNGHGTQVDRQEVLTGEKATAPEDPSETGYTFDGWFTDDGTFVSAYDFNSAVTANTTLYAKWTAIVYEIAYFLNGGEDDLSNPASYTIETETITLVAPTRTGYDFKGWYGNRLFDGDVIKTIPKGSTGKVNLYAKWTPTTYVIKFHSNGGPDVPDLAAGYETEISIPTPEWEGYTFDGWFTDDVDFQNKFESTTMPLHGAHLYAKWTAVVYDIAYFLNGGEDDLSNPASYTIETETITLVAPTRTGYDFKGWYGNRLFDGDVIKTIPKGSTGKVNLYAKWTPTTYVIKFHSNGGPDVPDLAAGYETEISIPTPEWEGYTFDGWFTDDVDFQNKFESTTMPLHGAHLYAKWTAIVYDIAYFLNGGKDDLSNPASYTIETETITLVAPKRTGYDFKGWYGNRLFDGDVIKTIPKGSTGKVNLYAKWTPTTYVIKFHSNGGPDVPDLAAGYETEISIPTPEWEGYTFDGWFTDDVDFQNKFESTTMPLHGAHLYAKWTVNQYTITFDTKGGSEVAPITQNYGTAVTAPENPARMGYLFAGWDKEIPDTMPAENLTITASWNMDVQATGYEGVYDGNAHGITVTAPEGATVTYSDAENGSYVATLTYADAGEYTVYYKASQEGYTDVKGSATVTITPATMTLVVAGYTGTYDGVAHSGTATPSVTEGSTVSYSVDDGTTWTTDVPTFTDADTVDVKVKAVNSNYQMVEDSYTVAIEKKAVTVAANDNQKVFGEIDPTFTANVDGLVGDDKVEYTLARATGETAGKYVITASGDAIQGNYTVSFTNGVFTISPVVTVVLADSVQLVCTEGATGAENCTEDGKSIDHTYGEETSPLPGAVIVDVTTGAVDTTWHFQGWFENEDGIEPEVTKIDAAETDPVVIYPFFEKTIEVVIGDSTTIPVVIDNNDTKDSIEAKVKEAAENSNPPIKPNPESYVKEPYEYTYSGEYECELKEDKYLCEAIFDSTAITYDVVINLPDSIKLDCTNSNGCTVDPKTGDTTITHKYGEETILPTANVVDTKTGKVDSTWEFQGWFDNENGQGDAIKTIGADVYGDTAIYPFFTKELDVEIADTTITVVIDNNDSKDSVDNKVTEAIRDAGIKDPTKPADSKYSYEFEKYEYDMETGKVTPVFKPTGREYKIVYMMPKAAALSKEIKTYTYGVGTVLPTASIKGDKDWMFMGWYADEGFIGERTKEITKKDVGKKVLYPMFQKDLRYSTRDESGVISVIYDEDVVNAIERTLAGVRPADYDESGVTYTFSKWVEKNGVYTAEYTEKTGINHRAIANFHVMVSGRTLEISGAKMGAKIAVFDMSGRMVAQGIVENGTTRVDLAKAGSYVVRVNNQVNRVNVR
ncbi:MAG: InlB B-repeat-containing protein [Fibrobacter sp.]|nr:InlB B-repeat-containing protein [Fibrobacter sp.]